MNPLGRVLGVDFGDKRTGVAVSDLLGYTAQPVCLIRESDAEKRLAAVAEQAREREAVRIVVGLPLNMDGSEGDRATLTRQFGDALAERTGLPVEYVDERLSSREADRILAGRGRKKRKQAGDVIAAQIILQTWLATQG